MTINTVSTATRICPVCDTHFERISHGKYCNPKCTKIAGRAKSKNQKGSDKKPNIYKCELCLEPFASLVENAKMCSVCRVLPKPELSTKSYFKSSSTLACENCQHWVPTTGAELGYSCQISFWMRCKPYLPDSKALAPKN